MGVMKLANWQNALGKLIGEGRNLWGSERSTPGSTRGPRVRCGGLAATVFYIPFFLKSVVARTQRPTRGPRVLPNPSSVSSVVNLRCRSCCCDSNRLNA